MSIALIVTAGYGNGTLSGDVNDVVTRGYSIGEAVEEVVITGGVKRTKKVRRMPDNFFPWEQEEDDIDDELIASVKKRKKLTLKPDFDSTLEGERLDAAIREEFIVHTQKERKRKKRKKAIEMLLLS